MPVEVVSIRIPPGVSFGIACVETDIEIRGRSELEVGAERIVVRMLRGDDTRFGAKAPGQEVGEGLAPAPDRKPKVLDMAVLHPLAALRAARVLEGRITGTRRAVEEAQPRRVDVLWRTYPRHVVEALVHGSGPLRSACCSPLGEDLNHSARSLGPVERTGCGSLDDLDPVDVCGVDIEERRRGLIRLPWGVIGVPVDANPIHIEQGGVVPARGVVAPQADRRARSGLASVVKHHRPRRAPLQHIHHILDRGRLHRGAADLVDAGSDFPASGRTGRSGHHDPLEVDGPEAELEFGGNGRVCRNGNLLRFGPEADELRGHCSGSHRYIEEQEPAPVVGQRPDFRISDAHLGAGHGLSGYRVDDRPSDRPGLSEGRVGCPEQEETGNGDSRPCRQEGW